jgi:transcriptional regulator with XRE-family HTH domain
MRKIKEALRLKWERGLSNRQIAAACGVSRPTVSEYLRRLAEAGLNWPLPEDLGETQLEQLLFPPPPDLPAEVRGIPDWHQIHEELKGKYVTLFLLWQEYPWTNDEYIRARMGADMQVLPGRSDLWLPESYPFTHVRLWHWPGGF